MKKKIAHFYTFMYFMPTQFLKGTRKKTRNENEIENNHWTRGIGLGLGEL